MSIVNSISRFSEYLKRHGLAATLRRAWLEGKRTIFAGRMAVFYCDLDDRKLRQVNIPTGMRLKRITALSELAPEQLQAITSFWNPKLASQNIRERFEKGASLWLVESEDQLAGYGWTIRGTPIAPYYFPLAPDDVQFFDFYVFPKFRGRALHWLLTGHILHALAVEPGTTGLVQNDSVSISGYGQDVQDSWPRDHSMGRRRACSLQADRHGARGPGNEGTEAE